MTSAIVAQTLLSADMSHFFEEIARIVAAGQTFLVRRQTQPLRALAQLIRDWDVVREYTRLNAMILELVKQRRVEGSDTGDLLSMLLARDESGDLLDDQEVAGEAVGLFIAGHETAANALTWTFHLLAGHPGAQDTLANELDRVLGGRLPTPEDPLPYTEMVIKEAMRLYPPAWVLVRRAGPGAVGGGYSLNPRGIVALSPYALHHDPRFFPDPDRFNPQRFDADREKALPRYAYFPFGGGPRVCIGSQFAMLEARLALATLMQGVRVHLTPGQTIAPEPLITLRPSGPIYIRLARR